MKKFLLTALLGAMTIGAYAATETFTVSYCKDGCRLGATGPNSAEAMAAASPFDLSQYAGMKIVQIDAYLNADESTLKNITNTEVFISNNLSTYTLLEKVTPQAAVYSREEVSVLSLKTDYVIPANVIYVGYNLTVTKVVGIGEKYPILLDQDVAQQGLFYLKSLTSTEGAWSTEYDSMGTPIIVLTIEKESFDNALSVSSPEIIYAEAGNGFDALLTLRNNGNSPVNTIAYKYSINGGEEFTNTITTEEPLAPGLKTYEVLFPINAIVETGDYELELTVTDINGVPNESTSATTKCEVDVFPYIPQHRPLVEEYTALGCGYCPRGYVAMEYISEEYPEDAVVICYHAEFQGNIDPMTVTAVMPVNTTSYPTASIDRLSVIDPYYGDYSNGEEDLKIVDDMFDRAAEVAIADIQIKKVEVVDKVINVDTDVIFMKPVANDDYRIGYVLSCNGLFDAGWAQKNYFSRDANFQNTPLIDKFYKLPGTVYGLTFNDVAINVDAMRGLSNSIMNVQVGTPVQNQYSFDVNNVTNLYKQSLNQYVDIEKMVVNAYVMNRRTGQIVNACKFRVGDVYSGVESVDADAAVVTTEFFDLTGRRVVNPDKGIFIRSEKLEDGTVRTVKVVK